MQFRLRCGNNVVIVRRMHSDWLAIEWGQRLQAARGERSRGSVAEAVGCNVSTISRIERGQVRPKDDLKLRIAAELGRPASDLFPLEVA